MWRSIIKRNYSQLLQRSLIQVGGPDAAPFLQGLMTNDIHHLEDATNKSLYCMFLNVQGRILHDALIYPFNSSFLIETADQGGKDLLVHLNRYRIRRKVTLSLLDPNVWRVYHVSDESFENRSTDGVQIVSRDPRVKELGWRCVTTNTFQEQLVDGAEIDRYTELRYRLGVSEGAGDLKIASSFPLECNCDYLHGVSFHKGCYIGQELTARTHHTGVVRKRMMPIKFESPPIDGVDIDAPILNEKGANVGKVRALTKNGLYGLGLLRVQQALTASELRIGNLKISTERPAWWPIEAPKEIV